jgi:hypothetical protein
VRTRTWPRPKRRRTRSNAPKTPWRPTSRRANRASNDPAHAVRPLAECYTSVTLYPIGIFDPDDLIESRIGVHDGNQFELKLDYVIDPDARRNRYQIEAYFFVPQSLGLDSHSYPREQFYADVQAYIRFKTPAVSLAELVDPSDPRSPLGRIPSLLERNGITGDIERDPLSHELRLLGCLVRANVRDEAAALRMRMRALEGKAGQRAILVEDLRVGIGRLLDDIERVLEHLRALRPAFMYRARPPWVSELFTYADEYVSLVVEGHLTMLLVELDRHASLHAPLSTARARIVDRIIAEQTHREAAGYPSVLHPLDADTHGDAESTQDGSLYTHRKSILKKLMSSVLFLEFERHREGRRVGHLVAGIAAAVAMLFATVAAIWSERVYGLNSLPFVVAVVVAYVFKDRIKEWLRTWFSTKLTRFLPDYSLTIHDPAHDVELGRCRETFAYLGSDQIPEEILQYRHADADDVLEPHTKRETVMRYVKDITIHGRRIKHVHGRLHDINDIIRFNVSNFLLRMDDPVRKIETYDRRADAVRAVSCPKRYHLNLVLVLRAADHAVSVERFRVILDKSGISELERVELPTVEVIRTLADRRAVGSHAPAAES